MFLYRDGRPDPGNQHPSFKDRVELKGMKDGDASVVLKNVTVSDTGTYECRVFEGGRDVRTCSVRLKVTDPGESLDQSCFLVMSEQQMMSDRSFCSAGHSDEDEARRFYLIMVFLPSISSLCFIILMIIVKLTGLKKKTETYKKSVISDTESNQL